MPTKQCKVLIVEDVPRDAELMIYELQQAGFCSDSRCVSDKAAMLEAVRGFVPDVILSDFTLPHFDGLSALAVRQLWCPETPFIVVSGSLGEERAVQILKAGATDYVLKHELMRLPTAVERALADGDAQRDRRRIARELESERRLLSKVLGSSAALIALLDAQGALVRINPAAAAACGLDQNEAIGQSYEQLFVEAGESNRGSDALRRIIERRQPKTALPPWRELNRIGRVVLWSVSFLDEPGSSGEAIVLAGIDVTEQQQQEETRARLVAIVDSSDDAIMSKTLDDVITSWNGGAQRIYGHSAGEAIGRSARMLVPPGNEDEEPRMLDRIKAGELIDHFQTVRRRKDGREIDVSMTISPLRDGSGKIIGASHISRDISEQKRHEELRLRSHQLEAENVRVHEASRLKSEFLANMSHELRTPLNAIIGFADLLHDERVPVNSKHHKEFLGHIRSSGHHLLQLINDILDLSKVEAGKLKFFAEPLELERIVGEVASILRTIAADKRIDLGVDLDSTLGRLVLDPARLKQVLYNYLSNALKFTPHGGRVVVRARADGPARFRLEVEDTGPGIAPHDVAKLFVEFEQLDDGRGKAHPGTGLGLALTKRLVEAQGGSVGVASRLGKGSVFHAILPRVFPPEPMAAQPASELTKSGAPTVLVIEDDARDQALLARTLTEAGFEVETVATGAQAIARARDQAFAAITLDLLLPDMTGLEVLAAIRSAGPNRDVPVVVVTVVAERASVTGFAVTDILAKPINKDALVAALRRVDTAGERPASVLVVNDDPSSARRMAETLEQIGYRAVCKQDGATALAEIGSLRPRAIILDLLMRDIDGFAFLDRLRQLPDSQHTPVLLWTDKDLDAGDYARLTGSARNVLHRGRGGAATLVQDLRAMLSSQ